MLSKHTFKVCESVALGLSHYYVGPNEKRVILPFEREQAKQLIPTLPKGWMQQKHSWDSCKK